MKGRKKNMFCLFLTIFSISAIAYMYMAFMVFNTNKSLSKISEQQARHFLRPQGNPTKAQHSGPPRLKNVMACNLPKLNPFDPIIMKYIPKPKNNNVRCDMNPKYPLLFQTDFHNNLITLKNPWDFGLINCCYKHLWRPNPGNDFYFWESSKCVPLKNNVTNIPLSHEFIAVLCRTKKNQHEANTKLRKKRRSKLRIIDAFAFVPDKPKMATITQKTANSRSNSGSASDPDLNILIIGLDSISHMHFLRSMPKTHQYLTQNLSAIGMNGYVKVGENTLPNFSAAFAGLDKNELKKSCWTSQFIEFDNCSFIWKNFSANGYWTSFWENEPDIATFHYYKTGFVNQPTDYYPRPLALYQDKHIAHNGSSFEEQLCLGPRHNVRVLLDYAEKMAWTMTKAKKDPPRKYFQIIWDNTLAHASPEISYFGDSVILSTLKYLKGNGFLNNTVLIFMSDHGFNMEGRTFQGLIESRMPILYFALPDWFSEKYPKASKNLKRNVRRLTTPFDLYETLVDFLSLEEKITNDAIITRQIELRRDLVVGNLSRGISLFLPIPLSRSCGSASIPIQWCVCHTTHKIPTNHIQVKIAAKRYMGYLRYQLKGHRECSRLKLQEIQSAKIVGVEERIKSNQTDEALTLILKTVPGNALFEVTMLRRPQGKWRISSDVRLNRYKNQSECLLGMKNLRKYCYCDKKKIKM